MTSRVRRQTAREWFKENPILGVDEPGVDTISGRTKYGNGRSRWNDLPFDGVEVPSTGSGGTSGSVYLGCTTPTMAKDIYLTTPFTPANVSDFPSWVNLDGDGGAAQITEAGVYLISFLWNSQSTPPEVLQSVIRFDTFTDYPYNVTRYRELPEGEDCYTQLIVLLPSEALPVRPKLRVTDSVGNEAVTLAYAEGQIIKIAPA